MSSWELRVEGRLMEDVSLNKVYKFSCCIQDLINYLKIVNA